MTKKDYILISNVLRELHYRCTALELSGLAKITINKMCERLEDNNTKFDRDKFIIACLK